MEKISLGKGVINYPMPVALVGVTVNGKVNFITAAWFSMVSNNPPRVAISLAKHHYSNSGIKENKVFSLCFPSEKHIKITDLCGLVSGARVDKSNFFELFYGELENAPMIKDFQFNVECSLVNTIENGFHETFIGDIIGMYADENVLTNGKVNLDILQPILLGQLNTEYRCLGEKIGQAWNIGRS